MRAKILAALGAAAAAAALSLGVEPELVDACLRAARVLVRFVSSWSFLA